MKSKTISQLLTVLMLGGCATNFQDLTSSVKDSIQKSVDSVAVSTKNVTNTSKSATQKQSVVYEGGAVTGSGKPIVIMDDFWADRELIYSGLSNMPINIRHYSTTSKHRVIDSRLKNRDAFETKAEEDRLMPIATARQQVIKDSALIVMVGGGFYVRPYDFSKKAFLIETRCDFPANDNAFTPTAVRCSPIPNLLLGVEKLADAQFIERARNENRMRQYVFYKIKTANRIEGRQIVTIEPVAMRAYDELGNKLITANFTATEQEKALINSTDWSAFK